MTRRRRSPELRRLDKLTPEQRRAEIAALVAESQAADELAPEIPRVADASEPAPTVEELVARALDERELAASAAELARFRHPAGPCDWCGLIASVVQPTNRVTGADSGPPHPEWHTFGDHHVCYPCASETSLAGTDAERIMFAALAVLGRASANRAVGIPTRDPAAFAKLRFLFCETPGAEGVWLPADRWSHVDRAALAEQFETVATGRDEPVPEPVTEKGPACPACGGRDYLVRPAGAFHWPGRESVYVGPEGPQVVGEEPSSRCATCVRRWLAQSEVPA